jgi:hypothetical protein
MAVGALPALALVWCWARIAVSNPLPTLFANGGLHGLSYLAAVSTVDFLINMALCLPAALAIRLISRRHVLLNTTLALLAFAVCSAIFTGLPMFSYGEIIWINYLLLLASLPIDVWLLSKFWRNASADLSKPMPPRYAT